MLQLKIALFTLNYKYLVMKKIVKFLLKPFAGKMMFQQLYEKLLLVIFYLMNYGAGSF